MNPILAKVRVVFALLAIAALTGVVDALGNLDIGDTLGAWGPIISLALASVLAYLTPERLDVLRRYIAGRSNPLR